MLVEIWVDVVCPWCFIGEGRLTRALEGFDRADEIELAFRPFQLDPTAPREPIPVIDAYTEKFGSRERATNMIRHVTAVAANEGTTIDLDKAQRANTFDAHRVVAMASNAGLGAEMMHRMFSAYFTEGRNMNDHATLAELAAEIGLDHDEVLDALSGDAWADEVREGIARAGEFGIHAVPTFVADDRLMASGALEEKALVAFLGQALTDAG